MEWIAIVVSCAGLFLAGINAGIFIVVKFNDLKHLETRMTNIDKNMTMIWDKVDKTAERVSAIEGELKIMERRLKDK